MLMINLQAAWSEQTKPNKNNNKNTKKKKKKKKKRKKKPVYVWSEIVSVRANVWTKATEFIKFSIVSQTSSFKNQQAREVISARNT